MHDTVRHGVLILGGSVGMEQGSGQTKEEG